MAKRHITIAINECQALAHALAEAKAMTANGLDFQAEEHSAFDRMRLERWQTENEIQQRAVYALLENVAERITATGIDADDTTLLDELAYYLSPQNTPARHSASDLKTLRRIVEAMEHGAGLLAALDKDKTNATRFENALRARLVLTTLLSARATKKREEDARRAAAQRAEEDQKRAERKRRRTERQRAHQ